MNYIQKNILIYFVLPNITNKIDITKLRGNMKIDEVIRSVERVGREDIQDIL